MSPQVFTRVYDILVEHAGAPECDRERFIAAHVDARDAIREWRFCGSLGFGGKYRVQHNIVTCYSEDETPERLAAIERTNTALAALVLR